MVKLNDYLYNGDTVLKILYKYTDDLREEARRENDPVEVAHCNFLLQITEMLEHNEFLTAQSQKIREFYKYMAQKYPYLAFTVKGRIKSLIRAEEKYNGNIVEYIYEYYLKNGTYPSVAELKNRLNCFRDLIAYRIVISMPRCHLNSEDDREKCELDILYEIANILPSFMEGRGFIAEVSGIADETAATVLSKGRLNEEFAVDTRLNEIVRPYYRDYVVNPRKSGYQSLHVTFYDITARSYIEVQLRTKDMDDLAEIGQANHLGYEKQQETDRARRDKIPVGECKFFDDAYERVMALQSLDLSKIYVNMFAAADNSLINDGCGLYRGRLILPYEHLSRFQNDRID